MSADTLAVTLADTLVDTLFVAHTAETAPAQVRPHLTRAERQFGFQALRAFTERVLATRGAAGEDCLRAFFAAGYDAGQALDVVLAIGASTLSTYANRLTGVPLDGAFAPFRWEAPRAGAI